MKMTYPRLLHNTYRFLVWGRGSLRGSAIYACFAPPPPPAYFEPVRRMFFESVFKIAILKKATIFVGECGSKVSQFAKNASFNVLIVLARDEHFLFFQTTTKGGTIALFKKKILWYPLWKCLLIFVGLRKDYFKCTSI